MTLDGNITSFGLTKEALAVSYTHLMMEQVMNWIKDIFLMILSLTFFEILVPDSEMEKYLKLIFSLIILLMILDPVIRYISD